MKRDRDADHIVVAHIIQAVASAFAISSGLASLGKVGLDWRLKRRRLQLMTKTVKHRTCLGLAGDGDEIDLVEDCEQLFNVKFSDAEMEKVINAGNLYDLIESEKNFTGRRARICYSQMGFYRLRRRLAELGFTRKITPSTRIHHILDELGMSFRTFRRHLVGDLGHLAPGAEIADGKKWIVSGLYLSGLLVWLAVSIVTAPMLAGTGWLSGFLAVSIGFVSYLPFTFMAGSFRTEPPVYCQTVGGLARVYGSKCFDDDPDAFEKASEIDAWDRFTVLLREFTGYGGPITRDTEFIGDAQDWPAPR